MTTTITVLGAGAWGTALAAHFARRSDLRVTLWARDPGRVREIAGRRTNERYLPGVTLPAALSISADFAIASRADLLVVATPVAALPALGDELARAGARAPLIWLSKGFLEVPPSPALPSGIALAHQVLGVRWPAPIGVVSGPSFAEEVASGLPTAVAVAATDSALAADVASLLRADTLRAYESDDLAGVEVGGAVKNVLAIAAGASDGLGFGNNARAALITRGLAETGRLLAALGGKRDTLMGLAGPGRPRAHVHGGPVAQPAGGARAGARDVAAAGSGRNRPRCRRRRGCPRRAHPVAPPWNRDADRRCRAWRPVSEPFAP